MAEVFWFKVRDEESGEHRTYPRKGTDEAIAAGGYRVGTGIERSGASGRSGCR